jgi:hypothetical protein
MLKLVEEHLLSCFLPKPNDTRTLIFIALGEGEKLGVGQRART